jgi:hypothetical protein
MMFPSFRIAAVKDFYVSSLIKLRHDSSNRNVKIRYFLEIAMSTATQKDMFDGSEVDTRIGCFYAHSYCVPCRWTILTEDASPGQTVHLSKHRVMDGTSKVCRVRVSTTTERRLMA